MEGFAVSVRDMNVSFDEQADEESETLSEEGDSATDGHDTEEGMKGERYTDFRVLKLMETLSPKCRRFLSTIRRTDSHGHYTVDDMNMPQFVGGRQAAIEDGGGEKLLGERAYPQAEGGAGHAGSGLLQHEEGGEHLCV